jgi:hypothetical protein
MFEYIWVSPYPISDEELNKEGELDGVDWWFRELVERKRRSRSEAQNEEEGWSNSAEPGSPMEDDG